MRVIFFGASQLGFVVCRHILEAGLAEVVALISVKQDFKISYAATGVHNYNHADFSELANQYSIPLIMVDKKMASYESVIQEYKPDLLIAVGWYHMIPKAIREIAPLGCIGIHASLLPKYRGGAPLVWAMINGEKETGVTLFYFEDGVDNGDIIGQNTFSIEEHETIKDVLNKATIGSLQLMSTFLPLLAQNNAPRFSQNENEATTVPQRSPKDGLIDWSWETARIKNFIRAQTKPYPGAFTIIEGKKVVLWDAEIVDL